MLTLLCSRSRSDSHSFRVSNGFIYDVEGPRAAIRLNGATRSDLTTVHAAAVSKEPKSWYFGVKPMDYETRRKKMLEIWRKHQQEN